MKTTCLAILTLLAFALALPAQTAPVHNGTTGQSTPAAAFLCSTPTFGATPGGFAESLCSACPFAAPGDPIRFYTYAHMPIGTAASGSSFVAVASLATVGNCTTQLSTWLSGSSGLLIVDPNYLYLTGCSFSSHSGYERFIDIFQMSVSQVPASPGWTWYVQLFEMDSNGDFHAQPWAAKHTVSF